MTEQKEIYLRKNNVAVSTIHTATHVVTIVMPLYNFHGVINYGLSQALTTPLCFINKKGNRPKIIKEVVDNFQKVQLLLDNDFEVLNQVVTKKLPRLDLNARNIMKDNIFITPVLNNRKVISHIEKTMDLDKDSEDYSSVLSEAKSFNYEELEAKLESVYSTANKQEDSFYTTVGNIINNSNLLGRLPEDTLTIEKVASLIEHSQTLGSCYNSDNENDGSQSDIIEAINKLHTERLLRHGITNNESNNDGDNSYFPIFISTKESKPSLKIVEEALKGVLDPAKSKQGIKTVIESGLLTSIDFSWLSHLQKIVELGFKKQANKPLSISELWLENNLGGLIGIKI